jgi:hypothetical protein
MDQINSITGRAIPHIGVTQEDRGRLWAYLYPLMVLSGALRRADWIEAAFWLIYLVGLSVVWRFGQKIAARTTPQKVMLVACWVASASLVLFGGMHVTARLVGLALAPIGFAADVMFARSSAAGNRT